MKENHFQHCTDFFKHARNRLDLKVKELKKSNDLEKVSKRGLTN